MADYVCSHILARERHSGHFMKLQEAKRWENVHDSPGYRLINTLSVGVMGVGEIGKEIATVCKGMGMSVSGMVRTKPSEADAVDGMTYYTTDELPLLLQSSDYVVNVRTALGTAGCHVVVPDVFAPGTRGHCWGGAPPRGLLPRWGRRGTHQCPPEFVFVLQYSTFPFMLTCHNPDGACWFERFFRRLQVQSGC